MVKIIKQGHYESSVIRFHCPICECVFETNESNYDIEQIAENYKLIYKAICPCCNNDVSAW